MGAITPIEWTATLQPDGSVTPGSSWNPIAAFDRTTGKRGWFCQKVSPGCTHCYAESMNRYRGNGHLYRAGELPSIEFKLVNLEDPLRWRKPRKVFVCSMTDLFGEWVSDDWIAQVFAVMQLAAQHTFIVLTKRPERMAQLLTSHEFAKRFDDHRERLRPKCGDFEYPLPNVWLGTSVEDQQRADERIPHLLSTPAAVRFLSCEPLLGPLDLSQWIESGCEDCPAGDPDCDAPDDGEWHCHDACEGPALHWGIVGGESGHGARPFNIVWAESLIEQFAAAGVACFVKQLGAKPHVHRASSHQSEGPGFRISIASIEIDTTLSLVDKKGGDWSEWPEALRVREFPQVPA